MSNIKLIFLVCLVQFSQPLFAVAETAQKVLALAELVSDGFELKAVSSSPSSENPTFILQIMYLQKATAIYACIGGMDVIMSKESGSAVLCNQVTR
jgi:hypothetical protein